MGLDKVGVLFVLLGLMALAAALLPRLLSRAPVSMPMVVLAGGVALFAAVPSLPTPDPLRYGTVTTHLSEVCVIVSLMGAGLAIDRPVGRAGWSSTWRLLAITMTLSIAVMAAAGIALLGLGVAAAILLAAALAPTDPVLASEVQVAEPAEDPDQPDEDEARFALTSEAGLNDGLAFPFTYLALGVATAGALTWPVLGRWVAIDLGWRLIAGVAVGLLVGWILRRLFFNTAVPSLRLAEHAEGFVALAATFLAYGTAEAVEGYGFLAVFVCACTIRAGERSHGYHRVLHSWVEQLERLLTVVLLLLLGGAIARGLLAPLEASRRGRRCRVPPPGPTPGGMARPDRWPNRATRARRHRLLRRPRHRHPVLHRVRPRARHRSTTPVGSGPSPDSPSPAPSCSTASPPPRP